VASQAGRDRANIVRAALAKDQAAIDTLLNKTDGLYHD
jgi:hypothetical protein